MQIVVETSGQEECQVRWSFSQVNLPRRCFWPGAVVSWEELVTFSSI